MSDQYYVWLGEEAVGPLSKEVLFSMRKAGSLSDQSLICPVGDSEWKSMGEVFPSEPSAIPPPPDPSRPAVESRRSKEDRELLRQYLVTILRPQLEFTPVVESFKDTLADIIPALGSLFGRRKAVVAGTTVSDSQTENTKREALFQQYRLLTLSETYMGSAPWISYLTAEKYSRFMECYGLATTAFSDFGDKKLVDETARLADALEVKSSGLMDAETSANIRELLSFQERQERVESGISILNEIIASPYRRLIQSKLSGGKATIERHYPTPKILPDGSLYKVIGNICLFAMVISGLAALIAFDTKNGILPNDPFGLGVERRQFVSFVAKSDLFGAALLLMPAIGLIASVISFKKAKTQRAAFSKEELRFRHESLREDQRIQSALEIVERLAGQFRSTVKPLFDELHQPIALDDFEGMLSELVAYRTWGREIEGRYTRT